MICGIGIDISQIDRFKSFDKFSKERLLEVFSKDEIEELARKKTDNSSDFIYQFYASRFAAKEAFYKALSNALVSLKVTDSTFSFKFARQHVQVIRTSWDIPALEVQWDKFEEKIGKKLPDLKTHLSLSHEKIHSVAVVIVEV